MSLIQNNTFFLYNDLYSVKNPNDRRNCPFNTCDTGNCIVGNYSSCDNCYKTEYCTNKQFADELKKHNQKYLGKTLENDDIKQVYNSEYIKSVNLLVGIIGIFSFIFYNK